MEIMKSRTPQRWFLFVLSVVLSLFTVQCRPVAQPTVAPAVQGPTQTPEQTSTETGATSKRITVLQHLLPASLDPHSDPTVEARNLYLLMFDALTRFDDQTLEIQPGLAESWEVIDETTWEFKLREGVTFHNGEPFNAEAVKFSFERILAPETEAPIRGRASAVVGVEVVDEYVVRVRTQFPDPTVPRGLAWYLIVPPRYFQEVGEERFIAHPIGTGPFTFVSWVPEESVTVQAFDDYWRGRAKIDEAVVRYVPESSTRAAALQAREVDIATQLSIDLVEDLEATDGIRVESATFANGLIIQFDLIEPTEPLQDKRVRQALNYAVDKESINQNLLLGRGAVLDGQIVTKEAFGYCDTVEAYPYDPEEAKRLLAEAGYAEGFDLTIHAPSGQYVQDTEIATVVAEQLREVGINVQLDQAERGRWLDYLFKRVPGPREAILVGWFSYGDAEFALRNSSTASPFKMWASEEFDQAIDAAKATFDPEERQELYCTALQLMRDEAPGIFLVQTPVIEGVSERVQGFQARPDQAIFVYPLDVSN